MQPATPSWTTYAYFQHPPTWLCNLVALLAGLLAVHGALLAAATSLADGAEERFMKVDEAILAAPGDLPAIEPVAVPTPIRDDEWGFAAVFPSPPERSVERVTTPNVNRDVTLYTSEFDDASYVVSVFDINLTTPTDYEARTQVAAERVGGTIASAGHRRIPMGEPGRAVEIFEAVIAFDGGTLRQMMTRQNFVFLTLFVVGEEVSAATYEAFRDSLVVDRRS